MQQRTARVVRSTSTDAPPRRQASVTHRASLPITDPSHPLELEADRAAAFALESTLPVALQSTANALLARKCSVCEDEERISAKHDAATFPTRAPRELVADLGSGSALDHETRTFMESRFQHDFSKVRVHDGSRADVAARQIRARAFTLGHRIAFRSGEYAPRSSAGQKLLAHELAHVVQQSRSTPTTGTIARDVDHRAGGAPGAGTQAVAGVDIFLGNLKIDFHTLDGTHRYALEQSGLQPGDYTAQVTVNDNDVDFVLEGFTGSFNFSYRVEPGQPDPSNFFGDQTSVAFHVHAEQAPELARTPAAQPKDPKATYLSPEEAQRRCESGDLHVKTFPFRGTRFGAAPIDAWRDGSQIVVKLPVYVRADSNFTAQTRTLPLDAFIGGVRLDPNEIVRVHVYEPHWYQLNLTGDSSGDEQREFCVTGEQMLQIADASTRATIVNIGLTVLDGASLFVPVGRLVAPVARGATTVTAAAMIGVADVAPTALGGVASRATTTIIEEQVVTKVGAQAIRTTVADTVVHAGVEAGAEAAPKAAAQAAAPTLTKSVTSAAARAGAAPAVSDLSGSAVRPAVAPAPTPNALPGAHPSAPTPAPTPNVAPGAHPPTTALATPAPPVPAGPSTLTPTITTNVVRAATNAVTAVERAEIARVEQQLNAIVRQAVHDVTTGQLGSGPAALRLASTATTDPLYRARLGNAIQEAAADAIDEAIIDGRLPANLTFNRGRQLPGGGSFSPLRPDLRLPLGAGREAVWDITTQAQAGHVDPKYLRSFVVYLAELLY